MNPTCLCCVAAQRFAPILQGPEADKLHALAEAQTQEATDRIFQALQCSSLFKFVSPLMLVFAISPRDQYSFWVAEMEFLRTAINSNPDFFISWPKVDEGHPRWGLVTCQGLPAANQLIVDSTLYFTYTILWPTEQLPRPKRKEMSSQGPQRRAGTTAIDSFAMPQKEQCFQCSEDGEPRPKQEMSPQGPQHRACTIAIDSFATRQREQCFECFEDGEEVVLKVHVCAEGTLSLQEGTKTICCAAQFCRSANGTYKQRGTPEFSLQDNVLLSHVFTFSHVETLRRLVRDGRADAPLCGSELQDPHERLCAVVGNKDALQSLCCLFRLMGNPAPAAEATQATHQADPCFVNSTMFGEFNSRNDKRIRFFRIQWGFPMRDGIGEEYSTLLNSVVNSAGRKRFWSQCHFLPVYARPVLDLSQQDVLKSVYSAVTSTLTGVPLPSPELDWSDFDAVLNLFNEIPRMNGYFSPRNILTTHVDNKIEVIDKVIKAPEEELSCVEDALAERPSPLGFTRSGRDVVAEFGFRWLMNSLSGTPEPAESVRAQWEEKFRDLVRGQQHKCTAVRTDVSLRSPDCYFQDPDAPKFFCLFVSGFVCREERNVSVTVQAKKYPKRDGSVEHVVPWENLSPSLQQSDHTLLCRMVQLVFNNRGTFADAFAFERHWSDVPLERYQAQNLERELRKWPFFLEESRWGRGGFNIFERIDLANVPVQGGDPKKGERNTFSPPQKRVFRKQ